MDKINVNTEALNTANKAIRDLNEHLAAVISKCEAELKKEFSGIDDNFKKYLTDYIDILHSYKNDVEVFEGENTTALMDRLTRLSEYSKTLYKRRSV